MIRLLFADDDWAQITMWAHYKDTEGYTHTDKYTATDIPEEYAPALNAVIEALVNIAAPWRARQVWAHLIEQPTGENNSDTIQLTVEAEGDNGGRRILTATDYPQFVLTDTSAIQFYKHYTHQ